MKKTIQTLIFALVAAVALSFGLLFGGCAGKVTLTFDAGEGTPVEKIVAEAGSQVELPLSLRKDYVLTGWSTQKEGGEKFSGTLTVPEEDTTYYAVWAEGYEVVFDADGGVYPEGAPSLTLAAGANLYDAVKDIAPTKSGLDFGAWFLGDSEVTNGARMPAETVTLTAKYKVEYAVERYLLNLSGNSYVRSAEVTYASDYVGTVVSPDAPSVTGFARTAAPAGQSPVESARLDADASRNVLKFYYDRLNFQILFNADSGLARGSVAPLEALFESTAALPANGFSYDGYRFAGWSTLSGGDVEYRPGELFAVTGDVVLYAVWDKGYTDRYGGNDLVFFPRLEPDVAVLLRGDREFTGVRDGDSFSFSPPAGGTLEGKVYGSAFSYRRSDLTGTYTFMKYSGDETFTPEFDERRTLTIDEYLNAAYTDGNRTYSGEVLYSEETGDYSFSGDGESFRFLPLRSDAFDYDGAFLVGGPEVNVYIDFVMVDPITGMGYVGQSMMLILDGYGVAMLGDMTNYLTYDGQYYVEGTYLIGTVEVYKIVCFIRDPDGILTGTEGAVMVNYVYTLPLDDPDFDGYVQATVFRGEYEGEHGETLVLDGFGPFADSFVYTANGETYKGIYSLSTDLTSGSVVTCTTETGDRFTFGIDTDTMRFSEPKPLISGEYTEYRFMDGNTLRPPFLVLYGASADGESGKANVYMPEEDGTGLVKAAEGTFTAEPIGRNSGHSLYTFTRTFCTPGYESEIAETLVFYNTVVTSTEDYFSYNVYCLLERRTGSDVTSYWEKYKVADGGELWVCNSVTAGGLGSLYIDRDGGVTEGQFTVGKNEHFEGAIGTFLHATEQGDLVSLYFDLSKDRDGNDLATRRDAVEQMLYVVQPTGVEAGGVGTQMLFLDGVSRVKYTTDQGESFLDGTYEPAGYTCFGETVYAFKVGENERFRFVVYSLAEYDDVPFATIYDSEFETELGEELDGFTFGGTGKFTVDGYHRATLDRGDGETIEGNYIRDELMQTAVFTDLHGKQYVLELNLSEKTFRISDWATGREWQLLDNNFEPIGGNYAVFTDNITEKIVSIRNASGNEISRGTYVVLDSVNETWGHEEYLLRSVTLGSGYPENVYRVTFAVNSEGVGACLVFNSDADGVFTDENWNVLLLDGYGEGMFSTSDFKGRGTYEVIDFGKDFIAFTIDDPDSVADGDLFYFLLDGENKLFHLTDYEAVAGVFFSDSLESISFGADGTAYLGSRSGPYYISGETAYVYLSDTPTGIPAPDGDEYVYNGKTYRRWNGAAFSLDGKVLLRDKDGQPVQDHPDLTATLAFTPNRTTNRNLAATFTFAGNEYLDESGAPARYTGYTLSLYASGDSLMGDTAGEFSPTVAYGNQRYPVEFGYVNGKYTFTVRAGYNSVEYLDHNARYFFQEPGKDSNGQPITITRGGRLYKNSFGFGAIMIDKPTISGDLLYLYEEDDPVYGAPLHFEGVPEDSVQVVGYLPGYGNRLELAFTAENDNKQYLLNYYEYYQGGVYFWCYGLFSYCDIEAGDRIVRAKTLLYTKMSRTPGYLDAQDGSGNGLGKISEVTLLDKETHEPILAYDLGVTPEGYDKSVWLIDRSDVVEYGSRGTCTWGTGYLVTFTETDGSLSATVKTYTFAQVVNYAQHLVNLFFDEEGNVVLAGVLAYYDLGSSNGYVGMSDPHGLTDNGNGTFSFYATWDGVLSRYTVKVEEGDKVTFQGSDGKTVTKPGYTVTVTAEKID